MSLKFSIEEIGKCWINCNKTLSYVGEGENNNESALQP